MIKANILFLTLLASSVCYADTNNLDKSINDLLTSHYQKYKSLEYFSGSAISIYLPNQPIKNYYIGQTSHDAQSKKISADTLFEIGSITKSFTAAIFLQLENEEKLKLDDPIKNWLPQYNKWANATPKSLLNMTSGLPNYSDMPLWNAAEYQEPTRVWKNEELIQFVYPPENFSPPLKSGYYYTNTGYVLLDLITQKITNHSFQEELMNRTIKRADLKNTYYFPGLIDPTIKERMAQGYSYNQYDNTFLVGKKLSNNNLSWAGAAGGVIANSEDIVKWVQNLFLNNTILDGQQKYKLMSIVSLKDGKPISMTTKDDPRGFGLGVAQAFSPDKGVGNYWYYEGETLGFRALYMYVPCNSVIIATVFNSATNSENDHAGDLIKGVYQLILKQYPMLQCQKHEVQQAKLDESNKKQQIAFSRDTTLLNA